MNKVLLLIVLFNFSVKGQNGSEKQVLYSGDQQVKLSKKYKFYLNKEYRQIKFNVTLQIDEPLDSIHIDTLGLLSLNEFKRKYPRIDSIQFFSDKVIGYEWYYKEFIFEKKGKWIPFFASDVREQVRAQKIYNKIESFNLKWNYEDDWEPFESVNIKLNINKEENSITYYLFDLIKGNVNQFAFFSEEGQPQLILKKDGKFQLILMFFKEEKIFCAKKSFLANRSKQLNFEFKEIMENELESFFKK